MADPEPLKPVTSKGAMVEVFEDEDPIKTQPSHKQLDGEEQQKKDDTPPCSYGKLLSTAEPLDWFLMAAGLIGAMGGGLLLPLFSIIFGDFINAFGNPSAYDFTNTINTLALKFVYLAIAGVFAMYLEVTCFVIAGERQTNRLRARYLAAALRQDIAFFDTAATTGGLLQGLNEDSIAVQQAISEKASNFVHHISTFLSGFLIAFSYGWSMTLVMLGCLPFLGIMGYAIAAFGSVGSKARAAAYAEASTIAQQAIASVRTVAAYNGQAAVIHAYDKALDKPLKEGVKGNVMLGLTLGGVQFIMYCSYAVALFFGAYRIAAGDYTGGQVVLVQIATLMASFALGQASPNLQHFGAGRSAGGRMFKIIERQPDLVDVGSSPAAHQHIANGGSPAAHHAASGSSSLAAPPALGDAEKHKSGLELAVVDPGKGLHMVEAYNGTGELSKVEGHLELRDVWFNYPARPDVAVFRGFTLDVPAGHTVALVGASGSGKSTAVQLIERFYDPMRGSVTLDGVDLRQLSLSWLRQQVGMVSQEPTLFATTIYDNIAIGKPGATKEEVLAAAMAANAHKFIHLLPEGYQTQVGERGVQLSGGQKQRIAIARAILKNPKVLLLDEATSALDTRSERIVQAALDKMVVGRTTVVVAHRLSTIQHAHAIAVVQAGQVVELGRHEELLKNPQGPYSILVQMQKQAAEKKKEEEGGQSDGKTSEEEEEQGVAEDDEDDALAAKGGNNGLAVAPAGSGVPSEAGIAGALNGGRVASVELPGSVAPGGTEVGPNSKMSAAAVRPSLRDALAAAPSGQGSDIDRAVVGPVSLQDAQGRRASGQLHRGSGSAAAPVVVVQDGKGDDANNKGEKKELSDKEREALDVARAKDVPMSRLFELNRPEWPYIIVGSISSFAAGLQHPALAFIFSDMITIFFLTDMDELKRKASFYAWMFFVLACGALITVAIQQACFGYAGTKLATRVRILLLGALLKQEIGFFDLDENSSGRLTSALATDAAYIRGAVGDAIGVALQNISTLAFGYVIALAYNWQMALVVTGTFPVLMLAMVLQMRWATGASSTSEALYAGANQYISEAFSSIRIIHAYNLQQYIAGMYNDMLERTRPVLTKQAHLGGIGMGFSFSTMFLLYAIILWFGGWQVDTGRADLESFLKGFLAILLAAMGMAQAGVAFPDLGKAKGAVGRVFPMLDRQPAINPDDTSATTPKDEVKGEVEFRDIKFTYPSRPSVVIYSNFNLHIPAGKVYALVGESGSGKSTVVSLLERFYDPVEGSVMLDGVDIRQLNLKWLRQQIGLVSQEPILFAGSVADNIRYGMPEETSLEEVEAAARTANAAEFVARLPEGYNTKVGEGGIQLSGGQKQRIAIARAVLKKPKILLLDEATSALDARSERVVQDALDHVMRGRTCLVIAHRLSTIKNAHAISVLYHGQVIEQGTHAELMLKPNGAYAKLVAAQGHAHGEGGKK